MSNLSDKEIDRLSREAADLYEPDHSSLSWSRLEQMLTERMPERPPDGFRFGRINPYFWGPAVVLLAGISFYLIKNKIYSQHSTPTAQSLNQTITPSSADISKANGNTIYKDSALSALSSLNSVPVAGNENNKVSSPGQSDQANRSTGTNPTSGGNRDAGVNDKSGTNQLPALSAATNRESNHSKSGKKGLGSKYIIPGSFATAGVLTANESNTALSAGLPASGSSAFGQSNALSGTQGSRIPFSLPPLASSEVSLGSVKGNDSLLNRAISANTHIPQKSLRINRSLNIGFAFGPDYTDAGGISNNQFGNNIGLTIGYYLTNKLSVNTGIFYSNKFYWSPGYGPGYPQQWTSGTPTTNAAAAPTIEYVNGSCNLYELPLTLRYDFAKSGKSKFFANAGISSYFIINQTNIYFFHSGYRPSAWKKTDNSQENYWFGIGDLSLGVETDIGKGFSFQAEPFLKVPLKHMGVENVKLNTYGFLLSFRYTPVLSRSKK